MGAAGRGARADLARAGRRHRHERTDRDQRQRRVQRLLHRTDGQLRPLGRRHHPHLRAAGRPRIEPLSRSSDGSRGSTDVGPLGPAGSGASPRQLGRLARPSLPVRVFHPLPACTVCLPSRFRLLHPKQRSAVRLPLSIHPSMIGIAAYRSGAGSACPSADRTRRLDRNRRAIPPLDPGRPPAPAAPGSRRPPPPWPLSPMTVPRRA